MRRVIASVAVSAAAFALGGCVAGVPELGEVPISQEQSVVKAVVESRTITDVLSVPMIVTAGAEYTISASARGRLIEGARGQYTFDAIEGAERRDIEAPKTSTLVEPIVPLGVEVGMGTPILMVRDSALVIQAELTPSQVLRIAEREPTAVRAQIQGSTGPFECTLNDPRPTERDGGYFLTCRLPLDVPAVVGSNGLLALTLDERVEVAALPLEAVAGSRDRGLVYVRQDMPPQEVTLGISDGAYVEIVHGLSIGDEVLVPSPSILHG